MVATPQVVTFGCRLNMVDSEQLRPCLPADGNLVVINTCAVTSEAVRQARQHIRRAARENPEARIVVTGCAAQVEPEQFARMPQVARVLGTAEKFDPANYAFGSELGTRVRVNDIMSMRETASHLVGTFGSRARAFIEVQTGCDHRCTFCIIPFARGNARSTPAGILIERIRALVGSGYQEVVLTGVDLTSYGTDLPGRPTLGQLVQRILTLVPDLPRLRLSSLDSVEVDAALLDALASDQRLMPHLHLSLQAGSDLILKRMKRRHLREDAIRFCQSVRALRPEIALGADFIAGFPTETEAQFEQTLDLVAACDLTYLHVFAYSARDGTAAARMPQVDPAVRKARAARLRSAGAQQLDKRLQALVGRTVDVLLDSARGTGHTACFAPAQVAGGGQHGAIIRGLVRGHDKGRLAVVAQAGAA